MCLSIFSSPQLSTADLIDALRTTARALERGEDDYGRHAVTLLRLPSEDTPDGARRPILPVDTRLKVLETLWSRLHLPLALHAGTLPESLVGFSDIVHAEATILTECLPSWLSADDRLVEARRLLAKREVPLLLHAPVLAQIAPSRRASPTSESPVELTDCPDCGVAPGALHLDRCDVERCPCCGGQFFSCACDGKSSMARWPWTGEWPGVRECREFGWYARLVRGQGWVACAADHPEATEDLNRLLSDAVWDPAQGRFVLPHATD